MNNPAPPTLKDVARAAGVSTATISRCVNDPSRVAKDTRARVEKAIDDLGYTPNFGGRALASNRTNTVGAIIPTMANAMFASGLQAFQETLSEAGVTLLVASHGYDMGHELAQIRALITHGADGLLLIGAERPQKTRDFLSLRKVPYVMAWSYKDDADCLFAGFDNVRAALLLTRHILALGHRRIAMIAGISKDNDRAGNRIEGVRQAIAEFGSPAVLTEVIESRYSLEAGADAFARIMSADTRPTVVICGNDVLAAGAVLYARDHGIQVPAEVSITGFDDINLASAVTPALTTVRVPQTAMGRAAAKLLLARLAGQQDLVSIELQTEIIMRNSLARLAAFSCSVPASGGSD
jgi:LacI family transcriptional regulator